MRASDPKDFRFTSSLQAIMHDADCFDRLRGMNLERFDPWKLYVYHHGGPEARPYLDRLIVEMSAFSSLMRPNNVRTIMEHESKNFFGTIVRYLFAMKTDFPLLTDLLVN